MHQMQLSMHKMQSPLMHVSPQFSFRHEWPINTAACCSYNTMHRNLHSRQRKRKSDDDQSARGDGILPLRYLFFSSNRCLLYILCVHCAWLHSVYVMETPRREKKMLKCHRCRCNHVSAFFLLILHPIMNHKLKNVCALHILFVFVLFLSLIQ